MDRNNRDEILKQMKERNQINSAREFYNISHYSYEHFINLTPTGIATNFNTVFEIMEAYANHRIKQLLDVSEEEIDDNFSKSPDNHIHPDRYRTEGAKWFRNHILNKLT